MPKQYMLQTKTTDNKMRLINASKSYIYIYKKVYLNLFHNINLKEKLSDDSKAFYKLFNKKQNNLDNNVNVPSIDTFFN